MDYPLQIIQWADSFGVGSDWAQIPREAPSEFLCTSVGYVVRESVDCIVVVPHIHGADEAIGAVESGCGDMTIPKSAIRKRLDLVVTQ